MSLRTRLLLAVLACVAAGLLVAGLITYVSLRGFLLERVDAQLRDARGPIAMALTDTAQSGFPGGPGEPNLPPGTYGQLRDSAGNVLNAIQFKYGDEDLPTPVSPRPPPHAGAGQQGHLPGRLDGRRSGLPRARRDRAERRGPHRRHPAERDTADADPAAHHRGRSSRSSCSAC